MGHSTDSHQKIEKIVHKQDIYVFHEKVFWNFLVTSGNVSSSTRRSSHTTILKTRSTTRKTSTSGTSRDPTTRQYTTAGNKGSRSAYTTAATNSTTKQSTHTATSTHGATTNIRGNGITFVLSESMNQISMLLSPLWHREYAAGTRRKKNEIWLSPMTKASIQTENSTTNWQHKNATKTSITQRLWTDSERSVRVTTVAVNPKDSSLGGKL